MLCRFAIKRLSSGCCHRCQHLASIPNVANCANIWQQLEAKTREASSLPTGAALCAAVADLGKKNCWQHAVQLLRRVASHSSLSQEQLPCFSAVASLCTKCSQWQAALAVLTLPEDLEPSVSMQNALLAALGNAGHWSRALEVLGAMREANLISFNTALQALERAGKWQHVLSLFQEMTGPDVRSLGAAISACAKGGDWQRALSLLHSMHGRQLDPDLHCHIGVIASFQRSLSWKLGLEYVKQLLERENEKLDEVGFNAALGLCETGCWQDALMLLSVSRSQGCQPSVQGLCSAVAALEARCSPSIVPHLDALYNEIRERALLLLTEIQASVSSEVAIKLGTTRGVDIVLAVDALHAAGRMTQELEDSFREVVCRPTVQQLQLSVASDHPSSKLAAQHGLGVYFTREALSALGIADAEGEEWLSVAKAAIASALARIFPDELPLRTSARHLLSWVSYLVFEPDNGTGSKHFRSNGEIVAQGQHRWPEGSDLLKPIFSSFDRSKHSERRALLKVLQRLVEQGVSSNATGTVRLFSCHTPCVSCLYVFAQFQARFPKVRFVVAFTPWAETRAFWQTWKELSDCLLHPEQSGTSARIMLLYPVHGMRS